MNSELNILIEKLLVLLASLSCYFAYVLFGPSYITFLLTLEEFFCRAMALIYVAAFMIPAVYDTQDELLIILIGENF